MFPGGVNPKQMKQMMKRMGIRMEELDAAQVIIKCVDKDVIIDNPNVVKTVVQGQDMFQVSGDVRVEEGDIGASINADDIKMVAGQAGVSEAKAKAALEACGGDLAQAILDLKK
ncbi:MAG TPA: nascent polypeptide-associated complex protein [Candidatus Altiarchaeales archaeon]|nr:nascent polypeptide-associated complex protein [Candidatus Altiarchaeales archaeon]